MLNRDLLPLPGSHVDPATLGAPAPGPFTFNDPAVPEQLAEARAALHAETLPTLEINILAAMWNCHPRRLRISEIYLAARSSVEDSLEPCTVAINHLAVVRLIDASGAPLFHYQLTRQGTFAALFLAIAGVSDKFTAATVEHDPPSPIARDSAEREIEHCHTGCGRIAAELCDCGNAVCSAHRYDAEGNHDPAGSCSSCYDEIVNERVRSG
jgi:hypothetical protein